MMTGSPSPLSRLARIAVTLTVAAAMVMAHTPAAKAQEISLIRDAEIEALLSDMARPVLQAAGLNPDEVHLYLVNDPRLNAFVAGGQNIFVTTGLLVRADNPGQVIGVLAHEAGHISGGHLARAGDALAGVQVASLVGMVLSLAAAVVAGGNTGTAIIAGAAGLGQQAQLSYSRVQESAADQAGLRFLDNAEISSRGLFEFISILAQQELRLPGRQDPYLRTHPVTQERVDVIATHLEKSPLKDKPYPADMLDRHERMKAKLRAFLDPPEHTIARLEKAESVVDRYSLSIAYYRNRQLDLALPEIDGLIRDEPRNPYFHELRGQMLFEHARIAEAAGSFQKAVDLYPGNSLLRTLLGQAQNEIPNDATIRLARMNLQEATRLEPDNAMAWYFLAVAEGRLGHFGMASLAQAEHALLAGGPLDALEFARRAQRFLEPDSPAWLRAEDIKTQVERRLPKRR